MRLPTLASVVLALGPALVSPSCVSPEGDARRLAQAAETLRWDVEFSERDLARVRAEVDALEPGPARAALVDRAEALSAAAGRAHRALDRVATSDDLAALLDDLTRLREGVADLRPAVIAAGS